MIDAERGARLYQDTHMAQYRSTSATARPQNPMASRVRCPASFQHEIPASEGNPQVPLGGCGIVAAFLAMPVLRRLVMRRIDLPSCSVMVTPKLRDDNITLVANARSSPPSSTAISTAGQKGARYKLEGLTVDPALLTGPARALDAIKSGNQLRLTATKFSVQAEGGLG